MTFLRLLLISVLIAIVLFCIGIATANAQQGLLKPSVCTDALIQTTNQGQLYPPCPPKTLYRPRQAPTVPEDIELQSGQTIDFANIVRYHGYNAYDDLFFGGFVWAKVQGEWALIPYYKVK